MMKIIALIVAAGTSQRFGTKIPKQYSLLNHKNLLRYSVETMMTHPLIDTVKIVIHPDHQDLYKKAVKGLELPPPILGGHTRQESVFNGLKEIDPSSCHYVLIHDAARPFIDHQLITDLIEEVQKNKAVIPLIPATDTLKKIESNGIIDQTLDRNLIGCAQTPQAFEYRIILEAHKKACHLSLTDDASIAEAANIKVYTIPGREENFKVTTLSDFKRAEAVINHSYEYRTGQGFDVHRFMPGDFITLCGVQIPYHQKLEGHSDADVGLHALTDALLATLSAGDIGHHFPPSDPQWKGADSTIFLKHASQLIYEKQGHIIHIDITIIAEAPKVGPHRLTMVNRLADLLQLSTDRISIKATTTEGLGFTGRKEGIAAQAIATVKLPVIP
ncbi:MAG: bifunctional 2-C-methyl-D-erythritol 4-phosphate cytidylyltransferase/2-C-methyl-D-erythritol 2,4-cyclodiphosphate synthase [Alphaproteobacteria bacterium]|nr:bifunctional 2-C-methyl-D-erythritol 4-phosphate cytidylyltransferase/2-C-methyl-D-erythritol 2,4-cyclodiphosphate synthase [Alphaproteobacteria bacterium]